MPDARASANRSHGGPVQLFYAKKGAPHRPTVARAGGIYLWDTEGKRWVEPMLVAQVRFLTWTADGLLRQVSYQGLREDKPAKDVMRERPR